MPLSTGKPPAHPSGSNTGSNTSPNTPNGTVADESGPTTLNFDTTPLNGTDSLRYGSVPSPGPEQDKTGFSSINSQRDTSSTQSQGNAPSSSSSQQPSHTIAASTSFFGIPFSLSSTSLRGTQSTQNVQNGGVEIDWISLYVVYMVTLVAESARGLMLPSTWPYYHSLGGQKSSLGIFVASFSLGRMFSTIPLGYLSDNFSISFVLTVASIFQIFGHFVYAIAPSLSVLFISRVVVGFGSATMSVCRAHLTRSIPHNVRTHHFAYLSGLQFIGFAVMPGVGGLMALLPNSKIFSYFAFNGFTYPAYALVLANAVCIFLIHQFYLDPPRAQPRFPSRRSASIARINAANSDGAAESPSPDTFALVVCLLLNIVFRGVIAEFETVTVPFMMEQFKVTFGTGSFFLSAVGFIGLILYLSFKALSQRFSDRFLVLLGLVFMILGCLPLAIRFVSLHLPLAIYVLCLGLTWSVAYPIGQTAILALFSKILYGLPAGGLLGIFSASGSIARLCMAVLAGQLWNLFGRESVFAVILAYVSISLVLLGVSYNRLKPRVASRQ